MLRFRHLVIDPDPPGAEHTLTLLADLTGSGLPDIIIGDNDSGLFWYENPGQPEAIWTRHHLAEAKGLGNGAALCDINGDGRLDIIAGQGAGGQELSWFECPTDPRQPWVRHLIEDRFSQYHDLAVGDVDGDGQPEFVMLSPESGVLAYYDIPDDPYREPWHGTCHLLAEDVAGQTGLALADLEQSGRLSILAGTSVYRPCHCMSAEFHQEPIAPGLGRTQAAVGDLNGDGWADVVLCEGEAAEGRLLWFAAPRWRPYLLTEDLDHTHSLQLADFTGSGRLDILVGEMGGQRRLTIYRNRGDSSFEACIVSRGVATHAAQVADMTGNGKPDIVSTSRNSGQIDLWLNECEKSGQETAITMANR